ncbi:hypothetical protein L1F30_11715 [Simiduia sp. 21SJ11W-1]|uniref:hypothetical protein n=1 Tax=Simiduia sp. 21SJ11W-1 TaxID=2909669 RepID=UPI00209E22A0|nr:hypothetical protein [Simiduia sp. 21SJ11W-1]UTA46827.1 hypothetical protein L1F30_11715 [Simiduia sp. 21SJ11W-1]
MTAQMAGDAGASALAYEAMLWVAVVALIVALALASGPALLLDHAGARRAAVASTAESTGARESSMDAAKQPANGCA